MTMLEPHPIGIPVPTPTVVSTPFWEGCRVGKLRFQTCANGHPNFNPVARCRICMSPELTWGTSAGLGTVYSYTTIWRPQTPAFVTPYVVAIVELDEGYRMMANLIGLELDDVRVGLPVKVEFHPISDDITLAYFSPRAA